LWRLTAAPYFARLNCAALDVPLDRITLNVSAGSAAITTLLLARSETQSTRLPGTSAALTASTCAAELSAAVVIVCAPSRVSTATLTVCPPDVVVTLGAA
jgi:hypothetical protein